MKVINHRVQGYQLLADGKLIAIPREAKHYPKDCLHRQKDAHAQTRILYQPQTGTGTSKRVSTEQEYTQKASVNTCESQRQAAQKQHEFSNIK